MKITNYIKESYNELVHKVSWPSWGDLQSSAVVVMVASAIIGLIILGMDSAFDNIMDFIYGLFNY